MGHESLFVKGKRHIYLYIFVIVLPVSMLCLCQSSINCFSITATRWSNSSFKLPGVAPTGMSLRILGNVSNVLAKGGRAT